MIRLCCLLLVVAVSGARAQTAAAPAIDIPALAANQAKRFPQPVLVGSLLGKDVLKPVEAQPVLGHVAAVTRRADGGLDMIIEYGGRLGFGERPISVPIEAVALLGPYVAVMDFTPEQLERFPSAPFPVTGALAPDAVIKVGLTRPFH